FRGARQDGFRAEGSRAVCPRPGGGGQQSSGRSGAPREDGSALAGPGRELLQLVQHRPPHLRLLLGPRPRMIAQATPVMSPAPEQVVGLKPWFPWPLSRWRWLNEPVRAERLAALRIGG